MRWMRFPTPPSPALRGSGAPRCARGVSLLELAVTIAIAVICATLAIPAYHHLLRENRSDTAIHLLTSLFASARATAVTYNRITTVCPTDGVSAWCREDGNWSRGWMMFTDTDGDRQPDAAEDVLRLQPFPIHPSLRMVSGTGRPQLRYLPDGRSAGSNLTIRLCDASQLLAEVVVNNGGRPRTSRANAGAPCPP